MIATEYNYDMAFLQQKPLFTSGSGGYFRYRIPALVVSQSGTILAFCEGRRFTGQDSDQIDLLLRRSFDGGSTFEEPDCIISEEGWVCGNPAAVVDQTTGVIWLLFCKNGMHDREIQICHGEADRTVWLTSSRDDGLTWAEPVEITGYVKLPGWAWYATGPGHGIQLTSGRLVIPCDHSLLIQSPGGEIVYHSHVIFSDDHGQTWQIGGSAPEGTNESTAVETMDGLLYLNARNAPRYQYQPDGTVSTQRAALYRATAWSDDGGNSFPHNGYDQALIEPICHASVCRLTDHFRHDRDRSHFFQSRQPGQGKPDRVSQL